MIKRTIRRVRRRYGNKRWGKNYRPPGWHNHWYYREDHKRMAERHREREYDDVLKTSMHHDGLRDRIAAAIVGVDDWCGVNDPKILADAVIESLNLKITVDYMSADQPRRNWMLAGHCTMSFTDDTTGDVNHD